MKKILLVEDDLNIIESLKELLTAEGFEVISANRQSQALDYIDEEKFDMILLDISLPDGSGYAICSAARANIATNRNKDVPIIFITAYDDEASVVTGLDMGAEDYITKPFRPRELVSRIKNVLRRNDKTKSIIEIGDLKVDSLMLLVFLNNKGVVLSRNKLLEEIWDIAGDFVNDNTLTVYIKRLREKIEDDPQNPKIIKTIRGLGYKVGD